MLDIDISPSSSALELKLTLEHMAATRFDYVGDRLITEFDASGVTIARHVWGPGDDEPLL